ncbi:MAG: secondary thiamine-phosphate synthase enzyme YjbQ [Candidatus Neomarinimicrobiota bacterium]|jgi:secondary thiamine-phosphate synthase enzyme|nr:secondary thiamine-phosphate synthase enzyme YjbQ [Candidatus Neomarinimicrobiota bacterium]|tara:strand:+ start:661 stop:1080 length:420 start_codon:yes stop_codon:yes gene_type:complete
MWIQKEITLQPKNRGYHLITDEVIAKFPEIKKINVGILTIFIKHTSASLTINENADFTVRNDFESHFNHMVPENAPYYQHTFEGSDDMPAHLKASILGSTISIPITNGNLNFGTWQGIYLCEHRNNKSRRNIILTLNGK